MRLQRLLAFSSLCFYVWGAIFQPDHHKEKWNHCEGNLYKGWVPLQLLLKNASVDFCCRCHEEKCISIAIFPTLKHVPFVWAYKIDHIGLSDLSDQDLLKNMETWYIPPSVVDDLLGGKVHSLPPQVTSRPSPSTTHILSGVFDPSAKYMPVGKWQNTVYIHWIAYRHTNAKGLSFEGAVVQNSQEKCKWKWLMVKQLVEILSGVFLATPMQTTLRNKDSLEEIPDSFSGAEKIEDYKETAVPCVTVTAMQVKEAKHDFIQNTKNSKPPLTSDMIRDMCSALIHRTSTGLKRCLERMILEKVNYTTSSPLLYSSVTSKPRNTKSDHHSQSNFQLYEIIHHRKYSTQKPQNGVELRAEENDHFYYLNGKIKRTMNHFGPAE